MIKPIKISILIVALCTLIIAISSVTYAWFSSTKASESQEFSRTGRLDVNYTKGVDVDGTLIPSLSREGGLSTTVYASKTSASINGEFTLLLDIIALPEVLKIPGFKWEVYKDGTSKVAWGSFVDASEGGTISLYTELLKTTDTSYTIYVWLDGSTVGNEVANATFSGLVRATAIQANA
ncbi:MAG: hypothetical protein Q4G04_00060 [bacterium]|nr:hypothetical protein [bacterium]